MTWMMAGCGLLLTGRFEGFVLFGATTAVLSIYGFWTSSFKGKDRAMSTKGQRFMYAPTTFEGCASGSHAQVCPQFEDLVCCP